MAGMADPAPLDPTAAPPLNPTAASLLGFLHHGPRSGWDLTVSAQECIGGFWSVTRSQVYRELAGLARAGLVRELPTEARERKPYELTDAGRDAFARWIAELPGPEVIRHPLLLFLSFGDHVPSARLTEAIEQHRTAHRENLARYRASVELVTDPFAAATLDFGIAYEEMVLAWLDRLPW
ncbi:transcriptional regulator, PadR family [Rhodococcoides kroppenstedtii]|uniref:Transcriptional regulator, PadR family n=2 Tax=Rhodococcoides kroppenstedtii TaxID=293050 RepID=A0A1I0TKH4_9NOCA|nr:transcriptional regulator, PadR family [Rhodococcus kroppenstedtii]